MRIIWTIVILIAVLIGYLLCYLVQAIVGAAARPDPSPQIKDWLTAALAFAALLVSSGALYFNWMKAKQETFLDIHAKLIDVEVQEGRRLLYHEIRSAADPARLLKEDEEKYDKVNRALAMYDVLGLYVRKRYVFKNWVLDEWGAALVRARPHAKHFIAHRESQGSFSAWPNFHALSLEAAVRNQKPFISQREKKPRTCQSCGAFHY